MLSIERLSVRLPAGFEHRAENIARYVCDELARFSVSHSQAIEHLEVPLAEVHPSQSNRQIALQIAQMITTVLTNRRG